MIPDRHQVEQVLLAALECSFYVSPTSPGLTWLELLEVASQFSLREGEVGDALARIKTEMNSGTKRFIPEHTQVFAWLAGQYVDPDYRDWKAADFVHKEMKDLSRTHGARGAKMERATLVERGVANGIDRLGLEAAISIDIHVGHLIEKDNMISYASGRETWPMPSEQLKASPAVLRQMPRNEIRVRAHSLVRDAVERRTDGRPSSADPLEAFIDRLDALGYSRFRLWWRQSVDEMKRGDVQTTPVSVTVLSAALVEGALTFVVQHARKIGSSAFGSSDFEGNPQRWKLDDLVKSAARGGKDAILDEKSRQRAEWLITARQRIHAGRMLSEYPDPVPNALPDYRPESALEAKATAELVIRQILDWLDRFPPIANKP